MNKKIFSIATVALMAASASPALASNLGLSARLSADTSASSSKMSIKLDVNSRTKADAQITARITDLGKLQARIDQMQKLSSEQKTSLNATVQAAIDEMTTLKAKIDADTDGATLKTDIQSIAKSYRVYVLVMPQIQIMTAADRAMDIAAKMTTLSGQLQTRITAALNVSLTDMNAKIADANVQAQAAVSEVSVLKPDNGDKTVFASNRAALKDARAKIKAATADLVAARKDAGNITKGLRVNSSTEVHATSTQE